MCGHCGCGTKTGATVLNPERKLPWAAIRTITTTSMPAGADIATGTTTGITMTTIMFMPTAPDIATAMSMMTGTMIMRTVTTTGTATTMAITCTRSTPWDYRGEAGAVVHRSWDA